MRPRSLLHVALAAVAVAMVIPAAATGSATSSWSNLSLTLGPACKAGGSVTYTWSGYGGAKDVVVDVYDSETGTYPVHQTLAGHGASGSVTVTFDGVSGHDYSATGSLVTKKGKASAPAAQEIRYGSAACSCGGRVDECHLAVRVNANWRL